MKLEILNFVRHGMLFADELKFVLESQDAADKNLELFAKTKDNSSPLPAYIISPVLQAVGLYARQVTSLDLSHNHLNKLPLSDLLGVLSTVPRSVTHLDLSWNQLSDYGVDGIKKILAAIPKTINTLAFRGQHLGKLGQDGLIALKAEIPTHFDDIDVRQNILEQLNEDEWKKVYAAYADVNISFDIAQNGVNEKPFAGHFSAIGLFAQQARTLAVQDELSKSESLTPSP